MAARDRYHGCDGDRDPGVYPTVLYTAPATGIEDAQADQRGLKSSQTKTANGDNYDDRRGVGLEP
jgi:hypothetical protein